jgi:hypothetical protein
VRRHQRGSRYEVVAIAISSAGTIEASTPMPGHSIAEFNQKNYSTREDQSDHQTSFQ